MSDHPTPPNDEELSAALDGEATDDEVAAIDASPPASERSAELAAAAAWVRAAAVPPLPSDAVDDLVARALDVPMAPRRVAGSSGPPRWLVAAAIAFLAAVGLALVFTGRDGSQELATSGGDASGSEQADGADERFEPVGGSVDDDLPPHGFATTTDRQDPTASAEGLAGAFDQLTADDLPALGTFADGDDVRESIADGFPPGVAPNEGQRGHAVPPIEAVQRCAAQVQALLDLDGDPVRQGWAVVGDDTAVVFEYDGTDLAADGGTTADGASTLVAVVEVDACQPITLFVR